MPLVSVVIPLYQTERYIGAAVRSVLAQTFEDFEVIVVDDGSSDGGPEIVASIKDARVRLVRQENRGLAGARNTGIRESAGLYIALLDADDLWHPRKLERLLRILDREPDVGLAFSASRFVDDNGAPIGLVQRPKRNEFAAHDVFCRNPVGNGSAPILRRIALDEISFFDERICRVCWFDESFRQSEDIECWTRIATLTNWRFAFLDEALTDYRVNTNGLSANTDRQLETWRRFRSKVAGYAPALERRYGNHAEAYQLRYLARRAVRAKTSSAPALRMMLQAIALSPRILLDEPARTGTTLAAAILQRALPSPIFARLEAWAIERSSRIAGLQV